MTWPLRTIPPDELTALSDDLLLDNFHWAQTNDKEYDLFRAELVRRLKGAEPRAKSQRPGVS